MKKKLLLIQPVAPAVKYLTDEGKFFPPLSLAYLAAMTPEDEWEIALITENKQKFRYQAADLVGITAFSINIARAYEIAAWYKAKGIPTVMGGWHVSFKTEEALQYCDSVVIGEAEGVWPKVLEDFKRGQLQQVYQGEKPELEQGGNVIPRHDLYQKYRYSWAVVETKRGCPLHCDFCSVSALYGTRWRARPVDEVLDEIATIPQKYIMFGDENFVGATPKNEAQTIELLTKWHQRGIKKRWACFATINLAFNETLLQWMQKTGCFMVFVGFESLDKEDLVDLKRFNTRFDYRAAIENIRGHGMAVIGSFILGLQNHTLAKVEQIINFCCEHNIDVPMFTFPSVFPGTAWWTRYEPLLKYRDFPQDYFTITSGFFIGFEHQHLSSADWIEINRQIFYQGYSWKKILKSVAHWARRRDFGAVMNVFFINLGNRMMYKKVMKLGERGEAEARRILLEKRSKPLI